MSNYVKMNCRRGIRVLHLINTAVNSTKSQSVHSKPKYKSEICEVSVPASG